MARASREAFADPSRQHREGARARLLRDAAHDSIATGLGVPREQLTLHSSRTAATRYAIYGLLHGSDVPPAIAVGAADHSDVLHAADAALAPPSRPGQRLSVLTDAPPTATRIDVDTQGRLSPDDLAEHVRRGRWSAVTTQTANQEVGSRPALTSIAGICAGAGVPLLVDAAATAAWEPLPHVGDVLIADAAQWGGPRGVGVVVVRPGVRFRPPSVVTPPSIADVPAIVAAAAALEAVRADATSAVRAHEQISRIRDALAQIDDVDLLGDPVDRAPHIVTASFLYVAGEAIVTELDRRGVSVGSGSACSSDTLEPSHVLAAMGALTHGNVRIAVMPETTDAEVDQLLSALPEVVAELRGGALQ
jgi:cysteine desulfurase